MPTRKDFKIEKCEDCIRITRTDVDGDLHTHRGYVNPKNGEHIGYYKTCGNKKYIEDYYADLVMK